MVSYAVQNEASPSLRAANGENATTFAGSWEAQRGGVIRRPERNSPSLGAASCDTVATFGWSWEAQRSGAIRRLECGLAVPAGCELRD